MMMNFDEYENLPSSSHTDHMLAGAIAGIMEHCVMYPLDSVKVNLAIFFFIEISYIILYT